jgi:peptidoglycan/LPS O-acetylase OafA/YrhL
MVTPPNRVRADIQALRGFAVLAVVLFHADEEVFSLGFLGVDIFFVISGFVVTPLILRIFINGYDFRTLTRNLLQFYKSRFYRLAPALGAVITVSSVAILIFGNMQDHQRFARQGIATLFLAGNLGAVRYSGNYFSPNPNPFIHSWSLSVEEQIYIFLPLAFIFLGLIYGFRRKSQIKLVAGVAIISMSAFLDPRLFNFINAQFGFTNHFDSSFYSPISRIWEFCLGSLTSLYFANKSCKKLANVFAFLPLFILVIIIPKVDLNFYFACIGIAVLTAFSIINKTLDHLPRSLTKNLVWLGDRSYSIYLFHMPLLYFAKYSTIQSIEDRQIIGVIAAVILSVFLGDISYKFVENRFRLRSGDNKKSSPRGVRKAISISVVLPLLCLVFIELQVVKNYQWILPNISSNQVKNNHQAFLRGCIDRVFDPVTCTWAVDRSKGNVLLVGDSQAYANADGVIKAGNSLGFNVVVSSESGCPFIGLDTTGAKIVDCLEWQRDIKGYIKEKKPEFVIISNRTTGYLNPGTGWRVLIDQNGNPVNNRKDSLRLYRLYLLKTIDFISIKSKVVLIQNIPEPFFNDANSLIKKLLDRQYSKAVDIDQFKFDSEVIGIEQKILSSKHNSILVDPKKALCYLEKCFTREYGNELFRDSWHLSVYGSIKLEALVSEALLKG